MPRLKRNGIVGIRTKWRKKSDRAWQLSQRFGGIAFILAGILIMIGNYLLFSVIWSLVYSVALMSWS